MKNIFDNLICFISIIMIAFFPTSNNGILFGKNHTILIWSIVCFVLFVCIFRHKITYVNILSFDLICVTYLSMITFFTIIKYNDVRVSIARIAPIMLLLLITNVRIRNVRNRKFTLVLLNIFSLVSIVWNIGILVRNPEVLQFTYKYFSQYFKYATYYAVIERSKPVMSFGVHTYAAYFYFLFFILNIFTYQKIKNKIYILYSVCFVLFTLLLVSTTAIIFFIMMSIWLFKVLIEEKDRILICCICIIFIWICFSKFNFLYSKLYLNITNGQNSFISRYSEQTVFKDNIKIILTSLGIGFTILDEMNLGYSDSGYIIYLTMGNLPLMMYIYWRIYVFLKNNISSQNLFSVLVVVFLFEFALPASLSYRFHFMILYLIYYLQGLEEEKI